MNEKLADQRESPTYVYVQRPHCPDCGGVRLLAYKSIRQPDSSTTRYTKCADCGRRVILVVE